MKGQTAYATQDGVQTPERRQLRAAAAIPREEIRVQTKVAIRENVNEETRGRRAKIMVGVEAHLRIKS